MTKEIEKYTTENLLSNLEFVSWVLKNENAGFWETKMLQNPGIAQNIAKAKEIILLLDDKPEVLDNQSVHEMWLKIEEFSNQHKDNVRRLSYRKAIGWAAIVVFAIIFGALAYQRMNNAEIHIFTETSGFINPVLLTSGGQTILLVSDSDDFTVRQEKNTVLFNDSVVFVADFQKTNSHQLNEIIVPSGKKLQIFFDDGSKVWVNTASKIAFPNSFEKKKREIFLEGEAYFNISENKTKPFIVNTTEVAIEVLGTQFNVSAYPEDGAVETVLLEGKVAVRRNLEFEIFNNDVILSPNQKISFIKNNKNWDITNDLNARDYIAWTEGWLQFSQENLNSVLTRLERVYDIKMIYSEGFPQHELISGKLDLKNSLNDVLLALSDVAEINFKIEENRVLIQKRIRK